MTKVLIADDHPLFRRGLKQLLFSVSAQWQVDEAGNGQEILDRVWHEDYDLIFLDIGLPGRNGLEILEEIMRAKPETRVLILSMYSEDQFATPAMKAGAAGYIGKDGEPQELIDAINLVLIRRGLFSYRRAQETHGGNEKRQAESAARTAFGAGA